MADWYNFSKPECSQLELFRQLHFTNILYCFWRELIYAESRISSWHWLSKLTHMSHSLKLSIYQFRFIILCWNTWVFYSALGSTEYKIILLNSQHNGHCWPLMDRVLHGLAAVRWSSVWNVMDLPTEQKIILNPLLFCCPTKFQTKRVPTEDLWKNQNSHKRVWFRRSQN